MKLNEQVNIKRIFASVREGEIIFVTDTYIAQYDIKNSQIRGQVAIEPESKIRSIASTQSKIAICGKHILIIWNDENKEEITVINEKFSIQSAFWERDDLLFYTTKNHWKYALMNGETGVLRTIEQPLHLVKKLKERKFLAFNESKKVFEI